MRHVNRHFVIALILILTLYGIGMGVIMHSVLPPMWNSGAPNLTATILMPNPTVSYLLSLTETANAIVFQQTLTQQIVLQTTTATLTLTAREAKSSQTVPELLTPTALTVND